MKFTGSLFIRKIVKEEIKQTNNCPQKVVYTQWIKSTEDISLGTLKNPNKEILDFKYQVT